MTITEIIAAVIGLAVLIFLLDQIYFAPKRRRNPKPKWRHNGDTGWYLKNGGFDDVETDAADDDPGA